MPTPITAFMCDHCGRKIYKHQTSAMIHESKCPWSRKNRACATCKHRSVDQVEVKTGVYRNDYTCAVFHTDLGETANLQMHCGMWKKAKKTPPQI